MSSAESHLGLLDDTVRSAERLCEGKLCCLRQRIRPNALRLFYKIYHRVDHSMNEHLNNFVVAHNTRASAALGELAPVIPRCKTDQFSRSLLPAAVACVLPFSVLSGVTLNSFKSALNLCLLTT